MLGTQTWTDWWCTNIVGVLAFVVPILVATIAWLVKIVIYHVRSVKKKKLDRDKFLKIFASLTDGQKAILHCLKRCYVKGGCYRRPYLNNRVAVHMIGLTNPKIDLKRFYPETIEGEQKMFDDISKLSNLGLIHLDESAIEQHFDLTGYGKFMADFIDKQYGLE